MGKQVDTRSMPYDERDEDTGQFQPTFSDDEFLSTVSNANLPTTSEVADSVGCEYRTAYARLRDLEEAGKVESRTVGNSLVWELNRT